MNKRLNPLGREQTEQAMQNPTHPDNESIFAASQICRAWANTLKSGINHPYILDIDETPVFFDLSYDYMYRKATEMRVNRGELNKGEDKGALCIMEG